MKKSCALFVLLALFIALASYASTPGMGIPGFVREAVANQPPGTLIGIGYANDRGTAHDRARADIAAQIRSDVETFSFYYTVGFENDPQAGFSRQEVVTRITSRATVHGASVAAESMDSQGAWWVVVALERETIGRIYPQMIRANRASIARLVNMPSAQKYSLDGFARFTAAARLAEDNIGYGALLFIAGLNGEPLDDSASFHLAAREIARAIPVAVNVHGDASGRIAGAFARAFAQAGLETTGGTGSRYVLDVAVNLSPSTGGPGGRFIFSNLELRSNLVDTVSGSVLLPYSVSVSDGLFPSQAAADNHVIFLAVNQIDSEFSGELARFISRFAPAQ